VRLILVCSMFMCCGCEPLLMLCGQHILHGVTIMTREGDESSAILVCRDEANTYPGAPLEGVTLYVRAERDNAFREWSRQTRYDGSAEVFSFVPFSMTIRLVKPGYRTVEYTVPRLPRTSPEEGVRKQLIVVMKRAKDDK